MASESGRRCSAAYCSLFVGKKRALRGKVLLLAIKTVSTPEENRRGQTRGWLAGGYEDVGDFTFLSLGFWQQVGLAAGYFVVGGIVGYWTSLQ